MQSDRWPYGNGADLALGRRLAKGESLKSKARQLGERVSRAERDSKVLRLTRGCVG